MCVQCLLFMKRSSTKWHWKKLHGIALFARVATPELPSHQWPHHSCQLRGPYQKLNCYFSFQWFCPIFKDITFEEKVPLLGWPLIYLKSVMAEPLSARQIQGWTQLLEQILLFSIWTNIIQRAQNTTFKEIKLL